jgi:hypothetical protein
MWITYREPKEGSSKRQWDISFSRYRSLDLWRVNLHNVLITWTCGDIYAGIQQRTNRKRVCVCVCGWVLWVGGFVGSCTGIARVCRCSEIYGTVVMALLWSSNVFIILHLETFKVYEFLFPTRMKLWASSVWSFFRWRGLVAIQHVTSFSSLCPDSEVFLEKFCNCWRRSFT